MTLHPVPGHGGAGGGLAADLTLQEEALLTGVLAPLLSRLGLTLQPAQSYSYKVDTQERETPQPLKMDEWKENNKDKHLPQNSPFFHQSMKIL